MGPDTNPAFDTFTPAVAYNSQNDECLVVWSGEDNNNGSSLMVWAIGSLEGCSDRVSLHCAKVERGSGVVKAARPKARSKSSSGAFLLMGNQGPPGFASVTHGAEPEPGLRAINPAVAYNSTDKECLVVWDGDDNNNKFEIFGQRFK
jgi:hypothetical protein